MEEGDMGRKNSFGKLCDKLETEYILNENEIVYVKQFIEQKFGNDMNMLLKIKAEAQASDYMVYVSFKISVTAMFFSIVGVIRQLIPNTEKIEWEIIINLFFLGIMFFVVIRLLCIDKYKTIERWRPYVLIAIQERIDEVEKEVNKKKKRK